MNEICDLDSKFDSLQKIISIFENCEYILIRNGDINQNLNTNIIIARFQNLLGVDFNLDIVNPRKVLKLFKLMVRKNIKLYDDYSMNRYIISNNEIKLFLPKKAGTPSKIELKNMVPVGEGVTIKDNKKTIKSLIGTSEVKLLLHQNQIKGILVEDTGIYQFPEYANDTFDENDCELLISYGFLSIDADEYKVYLGKDTQNNYWMHTAIEIDSNNSIAILENITKRNLDNLLI